MKIEMGESLFYSWLRHVKACQIVQTNWKVSQHWELKHEAEIEAMMKTIDNHFSSKYGYGIFKGNVSHRQLLQQGECDALGVQLSDSGNKTYAIDVAFHEAGLNYGDRRTTVMKVIEKCARTAFCLYGYMNAKDTEIIFASPKINPAVLNDLEPCISDLNDIFSENGFDFIFCVIANEEFNGQVLQPILNASKGVADTSELFLRSYQLFTLFSGEKASRTASPLPRKTSARASSADIEDEYINSDAYCEMKVGQLAQRILDKMLREGAATEEEIEAMQTAEYSKEHFDLQYPLLVKYDGGGTITHYYATPITIRNTQYRLCCEWFEKNGGNNDRPYLLKWIALHTKKEQG